MERISGNVSAELLEPECKPRTLEARVTGQEYSLARPEGRSHRSLPPDTPRRFAARPKFFEDVAIAQRVHRLPKTCVLIGGKLPVGRQPLHGLFLPQSVVIIDIINRLH